MTYVTAGYAGCWRRLANVIMRFAAKSVTAVISVIADTGSHAHAAAAIPWYERICATIRRAHPAESSVKLQSINWALKRRRMPENAGRTRGPIEKTIMAKNPTVNAWREAPQIPGAVAVTDAQIPSSAATIAQA